MILAFIMIALLLRCFWFCICVLSALVCQVEWTTSPPSLSQLWMTPAGPAGSLYFLLPSLAIVWPIFVNTVLIFIIFLEKVLHQPIFLCNLCINGLYGATGLYPPLLYYLLNVISLEECAIQSFAIFTYAIGEFTNLCVMAFDRYLAICRPLYYHTVMTTITVWRLLTFIWMFPCCTAILMILMTLRFPICMNQINKLYCEIWVLERLACSRDIHKSLTWNPSQVSSLWSRVRVESQVI